MSLLSRMVAATPARCFTSIAALCVLTAAGWVRGEEDETFKLAPNNPDVVAVFEAAEFFNSPAFKKVATGYPEFAKKLNEPLDKNTKLTPRDIESIFVAANTTKQEFVVVFNLAKEFDLDDLLDEKQRGRHEEIGDYTLYVIEDDNAVCLVDETTIAVGPQKTLRAVLKRNAVAEVSEALIDAWDNVDDDEHLYVVANLEALASQGTSAIPAGVPLSPETLKKLKSATLTANAGKQQITLSTSLNCTDNETARQLKALFDVVLQGSLQQGGAIPEDAKQALSTLKSSVDDEILTISCHFGLDVVLNQIKSQLVTDAPAAP